MNEGVGAALLVRTKPWRCEDGWCLSVRPSIGIAHLVHGARTSADRTTFAWNVGVNLMLPVF
jgi:hypothetical protein